MKSCEDHQIALEMRRHGALDPVATREVEAHLSTCAECQRAEAQAEALADMLRASPGPGPSQHAAIMERAAREERIGAVLPWGVLLSFVLQGALLSWLIDADNLLRLWAIFCIAGVLAAVGSAFLIRWSRNRARRAMSEGVEAWIARRRKDLLASRAQMKVLRFAVPALALATGIAAVRETVGDGSRAPLLWACAIIFSIGVEANRRMGRYAERQLRSLDEVRP